MKSIRYTKFTGDDFGLSAEDLMRALADFMLQSGFNDPYMQFSEWNEHTLEDLKRAIEEALQRGDFLDEERAEQIRQQMESMTEEQLDQMLSRMVQKLADEGYDPVYGARPLKRAVQNLLLNPLSLEVLEGHIKDRDSVEAKLDHGKVMFVKA